MKADLIILVADNNIKNVVDAILRRHRSLSIREIEFKSIVHPDRDPGCYRRAHNVLRSFGNQFSKAMVLFDHSGSGGEQRERCEIESAVEERLNNNGWKDNAKVIVMDPEIEIWIWNETFQVAKILGWDNEHFSPRQWLQQKGLWDPGRPKPNDPKKAIEIVLRKTKKPRSSSLYKKIAEQSSLKKCKVPSFQKFRNTLQHWFPA